MTGLLPGEEPQVAGRYDVVARRAAYREVVRSEGDLVGWLRAHPFLLDSLLAAALVAVTVPGLWLARDYLAVEVHDPDALGVVLAVASCVPVAWRRRAPEIAFWSSLAASVASPALGYLQGLSGVPVLLLLYAAAVYRSRRASLRCLIGALATTVVVLLVDPFPDNPVDYVATLAIFFAGWAFGRSMRLRRAYVVQLEGRTAQLQATRDADTRAVLAEERGRIARELHDVVAHHVSVMTVQAAGARRTLARDPERAGAAMAAVESTGRAALAEMRRIVGVLRSDAEPVTDQLAPQPGLAELDRLVRQVRDAGLAVRLDVRGAPRPVGPGVDLSAYRVVQEALTNTLKHAGPARATVTVCYAPDELEVVVSDDGRGAAAGLGADTERPGHGLPGMRERVALYGGRLSVGPRTGGGFEVRASFPLEGTSA